MYHFEFVSKKRRAPIKHDLIAIITEVQNLLRNELSMVMIMQKTPPALSRSNIKTV